ncbi:hypothetical protein AB6D60_22455 [Vibrio splendidus]
MKETIKIFKGGSLSSTSLIKESNVVSVVKKCSSTHEREYGLMRLLSQKSKMEIMSTTFPYLFPKVLDLRHNDGFLELYLEYLDSHTDVIELLCQEELDKNLIERMANNILQELGRLHDFSIGSSLSANAFECYFKEELLKPISEFANYDEQTSMASNNINGRLIKNIAKWNAFYDVFNTIDWDEIDLTQSYTHGNATLENIMYCSSSDSVKFIDCYEENIFHTKYNDISQLLQCSKHMYSYIMRSEVFNEECLDKNNHINNIKIFNDVIEKFIFQNFNKSEKLLIRLYELSQFTRMLPFKAKANDIYGFGRFYWKASEIAHNYFGGFK